VADRRGSRFVLEVIFLVGLAAAVTIAKLRPIEIAAAMLVGWLIVALLEWAAWRDEPHYGSGLPPRYYVPRLNLPPAQPLEQVAGGYPDAQRDEAPTWIASAALRSEVLGEWPVAPAEARPEPEPDPWTVAALPAAPLDELPEPEAQPVAVLDSEPLEEEQPPLDVVLIHSARGLARYSLDPLGEPPPRRRFGRGPANLGTVEIPARPAGLRPLPGEASRQS
jgi:hypothetical protein